MRTIHTIKSSNKNVVAYYENDESLNQSSDYYQSEQHKPQWYGKGAQQLGLQGPVEPEQFKQVLRGESLDGKRIRPKPLQHCERYAIDFTLSAPKSVSIVAELGDDPRVFAAHIKAVKATLDVIESINAQARRMEGNKRVVERTDNIVAAMIHHCTSRENDPNTHTHTLVMNATLRCDGQWRSLYPEGIMHADWVDHYYLSQLEPELNSIGYETYRTRNGFEIVGISRQDIEIFSKRTMKAVEKVKESGQALTPKNLKRAAHATRKAKDHDLELTQLREIWKAEAQQNGIVIPIPKPYPIKKNSGDRQES